MRRIDPPRFRETMRRLAASVCVLTTRGQDGQAIGLTATAVCSLSSDPPMLLCCLNRSNASTAAFAQASCLAVNILPDGLHGTARTFASGMAQSERFATGDWDTLVTGAPILSDALAALDCRIAHHTDVATHRVFFCDVLDVRLGAAPAAPLLYAMGTYGSFVTAPEPTT